MRLWSVSVGIWAHSAKRVVNCETREDISTTPESSCSVVTVKQRHLSTNRILCQKLGEFFYESINVKWCFDLSLGPWSGYHPSKEQIFSGLTQPNIFLLYPLRLNYSDWPNWLERQLQVNVIFVCPSLLIKAVLWLRLVFGIIISHPKTISMCVIMYVCALLQCTVEQNSTKKNPFPRIYIFYTQTKLHSYKHTYIHTYSRTFIQIHIGLLDFFFYYKKQFDILLLCIRCYTVRARSLLKSMHFLLVVSRSCVCKLLQVCATGHSEYQIGLNRGSDKLSIKAKYIR